MKKININQFVKKKNNSKIIFTAGPSSLLVENITGLGPCFGRGDKNYENIEKRVLNNIRKISGHNKIVRFQGSGSLALEIMSKNFLNGKVLVISTGYYSDRIFNLCKEIKEIRSLKKIDWKKIDQINENYDWIWACSTETSCGLKIPIEKLKKLSKKCNSKLMLDATGSIGLENKHYLADVISFSSCKGLFGLTGASFICYNKEPKNKISSFYLNLFNHLNKKMTGPYHTILSLDDVLKKHSHFKQSVIENKKKFLKDMRKFISMPYEYQPLLCTYVDCKVITGNKKVILYKPRNDLKGSVVCHLGEVHLGKSSKGNIQKNLKII